MNPSGFITLFTLVALPVAVAGPAAYGVCQAGCASIVVACYAAAGAVFGAIAGAAAPPAVVACNVAFGKCQCACAMSAICPIP
ncbi:hypothetical protein CTRI78_v009826 [Colletotrichum trifolii]|uniref:Uncharacterized protein n=1 Tax=Colletotrichum trifolii TaxID=5466 RepID=A0A4R8QPN9_COLTR|nr:hypothetical protein CTRI78_v009826 [Colletotrichum trifolii]